MPRKDTVCIVTHGKAALSDQFLLPGVGTLSAGPPDAAETLLFLHGWGGCKELWWNALADLGGAFRVIALDLPGTGGTPLPPDVRTMPDMARWVCDVCRRLGLPAVTLVGHSFGGNLAAQVALDFPGEFAASSWWTPPWNRTRCRSAPAGR